MALVKYIGTATEYQGESFTKSLTKEDGSKWLNNEICDYVLVNSAGIEMSTGSLVRSTDELSMTVQVPSSDTESLVGEFLLLVYLKDTNDSDFANVIAEYRIEYLEKKAQE